MKPRSTHRLPLAPPDRGGRAPRGRALRLVLRSRDRPGASAAATQPWVASFHGSARARHVRGERATGCRRTSAQRGHRGRQTPQLWLGHPGALQTRVRGQGGRAEQALSSLWLLETLGRVSGSQCTRKVSGFVLRGLPMCPDVPFLPVRLDHPDSTPCSREASISAQGHFLRSWRSGLSTSMWGHDESHQSQLPWPGLLGGEHRTGTGRDI